MGVIRLETSNDTLQKYYVDLSSFDNKISV